MAVQDRGIALFDARMKKTNKVSDGFYRATSTKRKQEIIPKGVRIYDLDEGIIYYGDGSTIGGVSIGGDNSMRKITVESGGTSLTTQVTATSTGEKVLFTDTKFGALQTGDGITFVESPGTLPTGLTEAEWFIIKPNDETSDEVIFASTRAKALADSGDTIGDSGAVGWFCATTTVCSTGGEDTLYIDAATNVTIPLPNEEQTESFGIKVVKSNGAGVVTISGLTTGGAVGGMTLNDSGESSIILRTLTGDYAEVVLDTDGDTYISTNIVNS